MKKILITANMTEEQVQNLLQSATTHFLMDNEIMIEIAQDAGKEKARADAQAERDQEREAAQQQKAKARAERYQKYIDTAHMSAKEVAEQFGVTPQTVNDYRSRLRKEGKFPGKEEIKKMASLEETKAQLEKAQETVARRKKATEPPTKEEIIKQRRAMYAKAQGMWNAASNQELAKWADEQVERTLELSLEDAAKALGVGTSTVADWRAKWLKAEPIKPSSRTYKKISEHV